MDEFGRCHVPAFGSWNGSDDLQLSECFEAARHVALFPYYSIDRDLYVAGDSYGYDDVTVTPAVFVIPRPRRKSRYPNVSEAEKGNWDVDVKEPQILDLSLSPPRKKKSYKPVDEDLYKITPELIYSKPKMKRGWGIFSSCCIPICGA